MRERLKELKAEYKRVDELDMPRWAYTYEEWFRLLIDKQLMRKEIVRLEKCISLL